MKLYTEGIFCRYVYMIVVSSGEVILVSFLWFFNSKKGCRGNLLACMIAIKKSFKIWIYIRDLSMATPHDGSCGLRRLCYTARQSSKHPFVFGRVLYWFSFKMFNRSGWNILLENHMRREYVIFYSENHIFGNAIRRCLLDKLNNFIEN